MFWSVKVIFLLSYHYGEIKLPSQGFGTETWLPQFRKKSQNKINFFKVREKSGNFSLIQGKFTALGEIGEKWNFKDNIMFFILSWRSAWFNMAGLFSSSCKCFSGTLFYAVCRFLIHLHVVISFSSVMQVQDGLWMKSWISFSPIFIF